MTTRRAAPLPPDLLALAPGSWRRGVPASHAGGHDGFAAAACPGKCLEALLPGAALLVRRG